MRLNSYGKMRTLNFDSVLTSFYFIIIVLLLDGIPVSISLKPKFPAVYVIGDSTVDPGNNNNPFSFVRSNFPPYGHEFAGGYATGRSSNGKLVCDFLGIKELLPAYLDPTLKPTDLLTGVSFGSSGSGLDDLTSLTASAFSVDKQLELLSECIERLKVEFGEEKVKEVVSEALFILSSGSNDLALTYFTMPIRRLQFNTTEYVDFLVQASSNTIKELYRLGARKIVVIGISPLGCVPYRRTLGGGLTRECDKDLNLASEQHKFELLQETYKLNEELQGSPILYFDAYSLIFDIILHFKDYGFEQASLGCCGTGTIEFGIFCNTMMWICPDPSKYIFWDSVHGTERLYELVANKLMYSILTKF